MSSSELALFLVASVCTACINDGPVAAGYDASPEAFAEAAPDVVPADAGGPVVREVAAAGEARFALLSNGDVWAWGFDTLATLGTLPSSSDPVCDDGADRCRAAPVKVTGIPPAAHVAGGDHHACIVAVDGAVWCWGSNESGQLGEPPASSPVCATNAVDGGSALVGPCDTPHAVAGIPDAVQQVAPGSSSTCALTVKGDVYCWGANGEGQLGNGAAGGSSATPVPVVSFAHDVVSIATSVAYDTHQVACAVRADGSVWCWGNDQSGQLAHDLDPLSDVEACGHPCSATPVHIALDADGNPFAGNRSVHPNYGAVLVVHQDGTVWGWGDPSFAGLGSGALVRPTRLSGMSGALAVTTRFDAGEILDASGHLWAFENAGRTDKVGIGAADGTGSAVSPVAVPSFGEVVDVAQGVTGGIALDSSGQLWLWGENEYDELAHPTGTGDQACGNGLLCALSPIRMTATF